MKRIAVIIPQVLCMSLLVIMIGCMRSHEGSPSVMKVVSNHDSPWVNGDIPIQKLLDSLKIKVASLHIEIEKSKYTLGVYSNTLLLKNYPVVFGGNAVDDKLKEGDGCTPEGVFGMRSKYAHAQWSKFIWIDYPNKSSWEKHTQAKQKGQISQAARIGGEIGIHGVPEGADYAIDERQNWTLGCISLKNKDVNELFPIFHKDILIHIRK